jgi:cardiolipin synthase (CMP-forming)
MMHNLPNWLTVSRIAVTPVIVGLLYSEEPWVLWLACLLFTMAAITDFFDGWLARTWRQTSDFGRLLDPIADKLLVAAVILVLVALGRIDGFAVFPALVILCREILVSGLREFLAGLSVSLPVGKLAKWKTAIQMVALGVLTVGHTKPWGLPLETAGEIGLWIAAALTLYTGYDYLRAAIIHIDRPARPREASQPRVEQALRAGGQR